jgi:predicted RNase H-like nuclease (RuvC/YqgF family)
MTREEKQEDKAGKPEEKRKRKLHTEEAKLKMKESQAKRTKNPREGLEIIVLDLKTNVQRMHASLREAAREYNISPGIISRRIKLNITKAYKKRYIFRSTEVGDE